MTNIEKKQNNLNTKKCPDEAVLNRYINHELSGKTLQETEAHIANCESCLEKIAFTSIVLKKERSFMLRSKEFFIKTIKGLNIWAIFSLIFFVLSFVYTRYFVQFLAAAIILSMKWIIDNKNTKMLIMIHEAWKNRSSQDQNDIHFKR